MKQDELQESKRELKQKESEEERESIHTSKQEMNLLFSINQKCMNLLQSCIKSIELHGGADLYHVYVFHTDLTEADQAELCDTPVNGVDWNFITVPKELFKDFPTTKRYPEQIYYRLAAPALLPASLDRVLYLDADIVVINSLLPLYHSDFGNDWFMACTNTGEALTRINRLRLGVDVEDDVPYVNTGVLFMNLEPLRQHLKLEDICRYAIENYDMLILPDQDILTALYGEHVKLLDRMVYNLSDRTLAAYNADPRNGYVSLQWVRQNSVIIHYFGRNKPWKEPYIGILDIFYHETKAALQLNSDTDELVIEKPKRQLRRFQNRANSEIKTKFHGRRKIG